MGENPDDVHAAIALSDAYRQLGKSDAAVELLESFADRHPNRLELLEALAVALREHLLNLEERKPRRALGLMMSGPMPWHVLEDPNDKIAVAWAYVSIAQLFVGSFDKAESARDRAFEFAATPTGKALFHFLLGFKHLAEYELTSARNEFLRAHRLDPNLLPARIALATMEAQEADFDGDRLFSSLIMPESARSATPVRLFVMFMLGCVADAYAAKGQLEEAIPRVSYALRMEPVGRLPDTRRFYAFRDQCVLNFIHACREGGVLGQAEQRLEEGVALRPRDPVLHWLSVHVHMFGDLRRDSPKIKMDSRSARRLIMATELGFTVRTAREHLLLSGAFGIEGRFIDCLREWVAARRKGGGVSSPEHVETLAREAVEEAKGRDAAVRRLQPVLKKAADLWLASAYFHLALVPGYLIDGEMDLAAEEILLASKLDREAAAECMFMVLELRVRGVDIARAEKRALARYLGIRRKLRAQETAGKERHTLGQLPMPLGLWSSPEPVAP